MILNGELRPGDSVISENLLAEQLGISRLTVRKAYQLLVEDGHFKAIQGKGTFVSSEIDFEKLKRINTSFGYMNRNTTIGIIFPEITLFFSDIIKIIEEKARSKGYTLNIMFNDTFAKEIQALESMIEKNVRGIIMTPIINNFEDDYRHFVKVFEKNIPVVMVGKPPFHVRCDAVYVDDILGTFEAVEYLIQKGNKKIIHLTNSQFDVEALNYGKEGYLRAMGEYGLDDYINVVEVGSNFNEFEIDNFLKTEKPQAIVTSGDQLAIYAFNSITRCGIDENEIEIIGYDNLAERFGTGYKFSTVEHPKEELGERAFNLIEELFNEKRDFNEDDYVKHIVLKAKLKMIKTP